MKLPVDFKLLFRNYNFDILDTEKHIELIVKTVLARGTWEQIEWLFEFYGFDKVREIFSKDFYGVQELPLPTIYLWGLIFLDEKEYWDYREKRNKMTLSEKWRQRRTV
ncbi:MAG TPA: hypothetical protein GXX15_10720 [Clostridia bacterium]|nr:hypothetical protein [Clostridia bacterium]